MCNLKNGMDSYYRPELKTFCLQAYLFTSLKKIKILMPVTHAHLWLMQYDHKLVLIYRDKGDVIGFYGKCYKFLSMRVLNLYFVGL